jgi:hypothetical protein
MVHARIKGEHEYDWFTYRNKTPMTLDFRGHAVKIENGQKFGVRPSSSGKYIRLVLPEELTKVMTIDLKTAKKLANGVGRG